MILVLFFLSFQVPASSNEYYIMNYFILLFCHWLMVDCSRLVRLAVLLRSWCSFRRESSEVFSWYLGTKSYIFRL